MLSEQALNEFKQIFFEEKGVELAPNEVIEKATKLINIFVAIYRPIEMKNEKLYSDSQRDF